MPWHGRQLTGSGRKELPRRSCTRSESKMKRPWPVILVAVLEFLAALIAWAVSFSLLVPGTRLDRMWELNEPVRDAFAAQARPVATLLLLIGGLAVAAGA